MVASVSMSGVLKLAACFVLFFLIGNCQAAVGFCPVLVSFGSSSFHFSLREGYLTGSLVGRCFRRFTGVDWFGGDINDEPIRDTNSAFGCCRRCNARYGFRVRAYIYRPRFNHCWCKDRLNLPSRCEDCQGRNYCEGTPTCSHQYNVDSFGNDLPNMPITGVMQPEDCCQHCQNNPACVAWLWRRDFNQCYLKSGTVPLTRCTECVFGRP